MGTSLSGLTPATTFDGLLKTSDNDALDATLKTIGTGDGTDSQLKIATNSTQMGNIQFVSSNVITTASLSTNLRIVSGSIAVNGDYSNPTANTRLHIKGSGATSATTSLLVQNSAGTDMLKVQDDSSLLMYRAANGAELLKITESGGNAILYANGNANRSLVLGYQNTLTAFNQTEFKTYNGTGYSEAMVITGNSNTNQFVGIGETTPTAKLHVKVGTTQDTIARFQDPLNASTYIDIKNDSVLTDYVGLFWGSTAKIRSKEVGSIFFDVSQAVVFADGNAAKSKIYSNGSMSIGASTIPSSTMAYIKGSGATSATTALLVQNSAGTEHLKVTDDGNVNIRQNLFVNHPSVSSRKLRLDWGSIYAEDNSSELSIGAVYSQNTSPRITLGGKTRSSGADAILVQTLNGMYIAPTASAENPSAQLQVKGSGATSATFALKAQNSGGETMFSIRDDKTIQIDGSRFTFNSSAFTSYADILLNTDLAVGTTTIAANTRAHIKGSGNDAATTALLVQNSDGTTLFSVKDSGYVDINPTNSSDGSFKVRGDGADNLLFVNANDNYVGIGGTQSSSAVRAYIKGKGATSATTALLVQNSAGTETFKVEDDGKVSLGGLSFKGTIITGNAYFSNIVYGANYYRQSNGSTTIGGGNAADSSSVLDVRSTTKGFLPPRMTDAERDAITTPAAGLMIYDTSNNQMNYWNGSSWIAF